jgi:anti-sigma regulatory factor (Ser/Thr protein kinase)
MTSPRFDADRHGPASENTARDSTARDSTARQNRVRGPVLRVLPGTAESARAARRLARQLLGDADPSAETVMLLVTELVTNAIVHSQSGAPGGTVTVALCPGPAGVLVQVRDDGGTTEPCLAAGSGGGEHGYGLLLVDSLADSWGTLPSPGGRITWCRVGRPPRPSSSWAGQ